MTNLHPVEELQQNLEEIMKLYRLIRWRKYLKLIIIGFLIGRDHQRRIATLFKRSQNILDNLLERLKDSEAENFTSLVQLVERIQFYKEELGKLRAFLILEDKIHEAQQILATQLKEEIEQKEKLIGRKVERILASQTYLVSSKKKEFINSIDAFEEDLNQYKSNHVLDNSYLDEIRKRLANSRENISNYNTAFIKQRKKDYKPLWSNGIFSLDDEQQTAVVVDDKHNLVVAAAGSGKTEVLTTRIAYIIKRRPDYSPPERILAIAYQNKATEQIEKRLLKRHNIQNTNVSTFHKLGKDILEQAGNIYYHTDIVGENKKHEVIEKIFHQKIDREPDFYNLFLDFVKTFYDKEDKGDEEAKDEVLSYAKERTYYAINNVRVQSRAEKEIMDFFLTHKLNDNDITIKYEPDVDEFRPDFYLPEYDLFLEHWAITRDGTVPDWFNQTTEEYKESMEMKKKWFSDRNKQLVETYAYEYNPNDPNNFIELLKKKLLAKIQNRQDEIFSFSLKNYKEIVELVWQSNWTPIEDVANFITIAKTYGLSPEIIRERLKTKKWTSKQKTFANLVIPVFIDYEIILNSYDKIDFEDMINKAISELDKNPNLRANAYDHILIDEYQDISAQRNKLIKRLMDRNPKCKLFCVGDDWQSIMGFSGSNVNFFVNFGDYFDDPAITIISTNYRSNKTIVDAGASLIKNNTCCQIQKPTKAAKNRTKPIRVLVSPHKNDYEYNYIQQIAEDCVNRIIGYLEEGYSPRDILVLSRFMRTRIKSRYRFISNIKTFLEKAKQNNLEIACGHENSTNGIRLLTAHKSKGLEAKVVFLLNVTKGIYGFPSEIEDSKVFEPARIEYPNQDSLEEERRLFYVAMTRAIEDLYIYTWEPSKSEFLEEITDFVGQERLNY